MGGRSHHSFNKRQKEQQRKEKAQKKIERRQARKLVPEADGPTLHDEVPTAAQDTADEQALGAKATPEGRLP